MTHKTSSAAVVVSCATWGNCGEKGGGGYDVRRHDDTYGYDDNATGKFEKMTEHASSLHSKFITDFRTLRSSKQRRLLLRVGVLVGRTGLAVVL